MVLRFRPQTGERLQVFLGRSAIVVATILGVSAAYLVYKTPGGLYKYLQTISIYLVMPITPAIVFGIMSKRVNMLGASASVLTGVIVSAVFVADELMGPELGSRLFPWLHHPLTFNYTYRGLWGTLAVMAVLFGVSLATKPPPPDKVEQTTIHWSDSRESKNSILPRSTRSFSASAGAHNESAASATARVLRFVFTGPRDSSCNGYVFLSPC